MNTHQQLPSATVFKVFCSGYHPRLEQVAYEQAVAKHPQSARAVIPAGHQRLSSRCRFLDWRRHLGCLVAVVGWVLGVGWSAAPAMAAVRLTELYPAPVSGESEWAELYNDSPTDSVNLTGWWLQDQVSSPSVISTLTDLVVPPNSYLKVSWSASKLNNSGDTVLLYDASNQVIDSVTFENAPSGQSWALTSTSLSSQPWSWQSPTPGSPNPVPTATPTPQPSTSPSPSPTAQPSPSLTPTSSPTPSPTLSPSPSPTPSPLATPTPPPTPVASSNELTITTIMACPSDSQPEWVTIRNLSDHTVTTTGWYVTDAANNRRNISSTLTAFATARIEFSASFINNTGETLWLYTPSNQVNQTIFLPSCAEKGVAFIQTESGWLAENALNQSEASDALPENSQNTASTSTTPLTTTTTTSAYFPNSTNYPSSSYLTSLYDSTLNSLADTTPAGNSAQVKELFQTQTIQLSVPLEATAIFKKPTKLFQISTTTNTNGAWELITGGGLISLSSASQLLKLITQRLPR